MGLQICHHTWFYSVLHQPRGFLHTLQAICGSLSPNSFRVYLLCLYGVCRCGDTGETTEVSRSLLPPRRSWGSNWCCQACWPVPYVLGCICSLLKLICVCLLVCVSAHVCTGACRRQRGVPGPLGQVTGICEQLDVSAGTLLAHTSADIS